MKQQLAFDTEFEFETVCPVCGFIGEADEFDGAGACLGYLFCPECMSEVDPHEGCAHDEKRCRCCEEQRQAELRIGPVYYGE